MSNKGIEKREKGDEKWAWHIWTERYASGTGKCDPE